MSAPYCVGCGLSGGLGCDAGRCSIPSHVSACGGEFCGGAVSSAIAARGNVRAHAFTTAHPAILQLARAWAALTPAQRASVLAIDREPFPRLEGEERGRERLPMLTGRGIPLSGEL